MITKWKKLILYCYHLSILLLITIKIIKDNNILTNYVYITYAYSVLSLLSYNTSCYWYWILFEYLQRFEWYQTKHWIQQNHKRERGNIYAHLTWHTEQNNLVYYIQGNNKQDDSISRIKIIKQYSQWVQRTICLLQLVTTGTFKS